MIIEIDRKELSEVRVSDPEPQPLVDGRVRMRVDRFALTSNNVTYAVFGDAMQYWSFFPAEDPDTWGRIPVWGFGEVIESTSDACKVGERFYGYYPMASEFVIEPGRSDTQGVTDLAPHRAPMAGAYNRYVRCATDPVYRSDREEQQMLLYPLFFTSFLIDDLLADNGDFDARQVIVSSASSKTAIGVAFLANRRGAHVVGLTSARNHAFVEGLGVYDRVLDYEDVAEIESVPGVYVDIAGDRDLLHAVHTGSAELLRYSMTVGATHWDHETEVTTPDLPGPAPAFFFAPAQITKRNDDWGPGELARRMAAAWADYSTWTDGWLELRGAAGAPAVIEAYEELLHGAADPRTGFIGSLVSATSGDA